MEEGEGIEPSNDGFVHHHDRLVRFDLVFRALGALCCDVAMGWLGIRLYSGSHLRDDRILHLALYAAGRLHRRRLWRKSL